jgi:hypothetical protein
MATHFFGTQSSTLLAPPEEIFSEESREETPGLRHEGGNALRGFFFAMLFNMLMFLTAAAGWVLCCSIR